MKLILSLAYVAILGILAHYIGESMPRCWFFENKFPYKTYRFECDGKLYDKINIKKWKNHLPDMSRVMKDMLPKRITFDATSASIDALIKETCVAEFVHKSLCIFSIGVYFIWKNYIGIILVSICIIGNLPFIIIQRYNRPHLISLRNRIYLREGKKKRAVTNTVM